MQKEITYNREVEMDLAKEENVSSYVLSRIGSIQQELEQLKRALANQMGVKKQKTKLKGLWKGIKVEEEDIQEAKRALFRNAHSF